MKSFSTIVFLAIVCATAQAGEEPCHDHSVEHQLAEANTFEDPCALAAAHLLPPPSVCFDREARYEYAMANGYACEITPIVFDKSVITTTALAVNSVFAIDMDGDLDIDILSANSTSDTVEWFENDGADPPTFTTHIIADTVDSARDVYAIDVDGDTDLDVISCSSIAGTIVWFENTGGGNFTERLVNGSESFPQSIFAADVDGDNDIDILSASSGSDRIRWYENNGGSPPSFTAQTITTNADSARSVYAADIDGDDDIDVLSASAFDGTIAWYENNGAANPSFTENILTTSAGGASDVYVVDLDGDTDLDILYAAPDADRVGWFESNGAFNPSFTEHIITTAQDGPQSVFAADLDGDTNLDVIVASKNDDTFAWHISDGSNPPNFMLLATANADGAQSVVAANVNGDASMDIVGGSSFDNTVAWYEPKEPPLGTCCLPNSDCEPDLCLVDCAELNAWAWNEGAACGEMTCPGLDDPAQFVVDLLDYDRFKQKIFDLASFETRYWTRPENAEAQEYIKARFESYGYDNVTFDPFTSSNQTRNNIYATKYGTENPTEMYILGAHMDSINLTLPQSNQFFAPGADDDASGTSSVMEMARAFAQVRTDVTIRFILWNAEEVGLVGSEAYAETHAPLQGTLDEPTWLGMIQQDMILFDHLETPDADVEWQASVTDQEAAHILAEFVAGAMGRYGDMPAEVGDNMNFTDSVPFEPYTAAISVRENQRVAEIGNGANPHWHQPTDVYDTYTEQDFTFGFNVVKMVCGAVGELVNASLYGDDDRDGDIDLADWQAFLNCVTGPGGGVPAGCGAHDIDFDLDVDFADAAKFQLAFTGG